MNGKQVEIFVPQNSASMYYNYKGTLSIVLFAVVYAYYNAIYADVSCQGRIFCGDAALHISYKKQNMTQKCSIPKFYLQVLKNNI
jgi:hypothetical protein